MNKKTKKNIHFCKPTKKKGLKTCYSKKSLEKMTQAWNKKYNDTLKDNLSEDELWNNLNNKLLDKCDSEWCWKKLDFIKELNDEEINNSFRPEMPSEWKQNPNAWLSTLDIDAVMYQYIDKYDNFYFLGTHPMDFAEKNEDDSCKVSNICQFNLKEFIDQDIDKLGLVLNLDKSHQSGSHWVCIFIDIKLSNIYYWDSYGVKPEKEVFDFVNVIKTQGKTLNKNFKFYINTYRHQFKNSECGVYCLWFLIKLLESKNSLKEYNRITVKKVKDEIMEKNRKVLFIS